MEKYAFEEPTVSRCHPPPIINLYLDPNPCSPALARPPLKQSRQNHALQSTAWAIDAHMTAYPFKPWNLKQLVHGKYLIARAIFICLLVICPGQIHCLETNWGEEAYP